VRPDGYRYAAGQWFRLELETASGAEAKTFSHASAPSDEWLEMATRQTGSPFKRALAGLRSGDKVTLMGPGGRLRLPGEQPRTLAFLVGGVGITPVRSMLRKAIASGETFTDTVVFYGDRDERCMTYLPELQAMADAGIRVVPVLEQPPSTWTGATGFITAELIARHVDLSDGRPVVVTGPPVMVDAMSEVLDTLEVAQDRRVVERFGVVQK